MKMLITLLSVCLLAASPHSRADVRLPKSTFTTDRMEEALKTAKEQKKPVAYLYTNTAMTCPLAAGVTEGFLEAVGKRCVLVYLPVKGGKSTVAAPVKEALEKGKFYPKLVLTASDGSGAQCFTYEAYQADSKKRRARSRGRLLPWLKNSPEPEDGTFRAFRRAVQPMICAGKGNIFTNRKSSIPTHRAMQMAFLGDRRGAVFSQMTIPAWTAREMPTDHQKNGMPVMAKSAASG